MGSGKSQDAGQQIVKQAGRKAGRHAGKQAGRQVIFPARFMTIYCVAKDATHFQGQRPGLKRGKYDCDGFPFDIYV